MGLFVVIAARHHRSVESSSKRSRRQADSRQHRCTVTTPLPPPPLPLSLPPLQNLLISPFYTLLLSLSLIILEPLIIINIAADTLTPQHFGRRESQTITSISAHASIGWARRRRWRAWWRFCWGMRANT